jgi:hypothetical protein
VFHYDVALEVLALASTQLAMALGNLVSGENVVRVPAKFVSTTEAGNLFLFYDIVIASAGSGDSNVPPSQGFALAWRSVISNA